MSEDDFLTRWSRRKQAAAVDAKRAKEEPAQPPAPQTPPAGADAQKQDEAFDLSTLPPIDSITAISDVRDFLRAGVPAELTRAALRRAWSADPAIRDFVGLSENSWDFTAPDSIPGFGPLESTEEIRQLVDRIVGRAREVAEAGGDDAAEPPQNAATASTSMQPEVSAGSQHDSVAGPATADASVGGTDSRVDIAMQNQPQSEQPANPQLRRSRGAALPQ